MVAQKGVFQFFFIIEKVTMGIRGEDKLKLFHFIRFLSFFFVHSGFSDIDKVPFYGSKYLYRWRLSDFFPFLFILMEK